MTAPKKVAVVIEPWKLEIFRRRLTAAGYSFKNAGHLTDGSLLLRVDTTNPEALAEVVKDAQVECFLTRKPE